MPENIAQAKYALIAQAHGLLTELQALGVDEIYVPEVEQTTKAESLVDIQNELHNCQRCPLAEERTNLVFGGGNPQAQIVFVGEGPGREEDQQGIPFVGEAGQLLDRILFAMGLQRSDIYICNVIKCRPPNNRNPANDEIAACEPFLQRQLAAIKPQVIIALGKFATQVLLGQPVAITKLRGQWQSYQNIPLMPTLHPAYLLRSPSAKRDVWHDMKQVLHHLRVS